MVNKLNTEDLNISDVSNKKVIEEILEKFNNIETK